MKRRALLALLPVIIFLFSTVSVSCKSNTDDVNTDNAPTHDADATVPPTDNSDENNTDNDCDNVVGDPCKHFFGSFHISAASFGLSPEMTARNSVFIML